MLSVVLYGEDLAYRILAAGLLMVWMVPEQTTPMVLVWAAAGVAGALLTLWGIGDWIMDKEASKDPPLKVASLGKIKVKQVNKSVTFHDPCQFLSRRAATEMPRQVLKAMGVELREPESSGILNWCCGGGGGLNGIGRYRQQRNIGLKVKRNQILATGAKLVIAPCHNCWDAIRDMEEIYEAGIRWSFLKPLLLNMVIIPDHLKPQEE